ncbi:MAG: ABC transporter ATP-binding protein [Gammaproteobacteria bacterium]|nr:ABC transporter ATP-binding protein [Gammaproteobacteria bacterium]
MAPNDRRVVEFRHVEKTYDGQTNVVKDLCLSIDRGEFLTLLGPSGSGKTTTLMMLAGFEDPTSGDIFLNGNSLARVPPYRRNMGIVFQNYALFPHKSVAENIAYPLIQRRQTKSEVAQRTLKAMQMVELDHLAARRPAQLSGGQQQRVALARALVFEPDLVLMDEPLGALDKKLREQMQLEIKHLHSALEMTVVYVTHDQSEALTMSDRVAVFNDGVIQQISDPRTIYEQPDNSFVANFIGENNTLDGTVVAINDEGCAVELGTGEVVAAQPVRVQRIGDATRLSIRPERLVLGVDGTMNGGLPATVVEIVYGGDHSMIRMARANGGELVAKLVAAHAESIAVGDALRVDWDPSHCRALDPV